MFLMVMKRMTSKMMGGMGNAMSFGKSNAKVYVQSGPDGGMIGGNGPRTAADDSGRHRAMKR